MKTFFTTLLIFLILMLVLGFAFREQIGDLLGYGAVADKPILYLYPEEETAVEVALTVDGALSCTYPAYDDGWRVTASPDGTLTDDAGREYYALYWEADLDADFDFTEGYCVAGEETADFLAEILPKLGLSAREVNEFIVYWLPKMQENAYNLIAFQNEAYTNAAQLDIVPAPDTVIRVFMAWKALDRAVEITEPVLPATPARDGFTAIEWGGACVS